MKKFHHNSKGQFRKLVEVSKNNRFKHQSVITSRMLFLVTAYRNYLINKGNPWAISGYVRDQLLVDAMSALFSSKMQSMLYIKELRDANAGCCCSMCGSLRSTQVDHFLPQQHYPEFSIFLPNLFPICACNQVKLSKTIGTKLGERFLHPAYDRKISERSIYVRIRSHGDTPTYTVIFKKPRRVRDTVAFDFHTRTLVSKQALADYVKDGFERFCRRPSNLIIGLKRRNPSSKAELVQLIRDELEESCIQHRSKNNWDSILFHALLERRTINWIWKRISVPGRAINGPLVAL